MLEYCEQNILELGYSYYCKMSNIYKVYIKKSHKEKDIKNFIEYNGVRLNDENVSLERIGDCVDVGSRFTNYTFEYPNNVVLHPRKILLKQTYIKVDRITKRSYCQIPIIGISFPLSSKTLISKDILVSYLILDVCPTFSITELTKKEAEEWACANLKYDEWAEEFLSKEA